MRRLLALPGALLPLHSPRRLPLSTARRSQEDCAEASLRMTRLFSVTEGDDESLLLAPSWVRYVLQVG